MWATVTGGNKKLACRSLDLCLAVGGPDVTVGYAGAPLPQPLDPPVPYDLYHTNTLITTLGDVASFFGVVNQYAYQWERCSPTGA